jgi:hypothetical protein
MRTALITISATTFLAAVALLGTFATRSHADPQPPYHVYAPNLAADSTAGTPTVPGGVPASPSPEPPAEFLLQGQCIETVGRTYEIVGYEIQSTPGNFFYSHAWATQQAEPFTHTGVLGAYATGFGGGWEQGWDAPVVDGRADFYAQLPNEPGTFTVEVLPGQREVVQGPPLVFNAPFDCIPLDLNVWVPPAHDLHFPLQGLAGVSVTSGNCLGFTTIIEVTVGANGALTFFQLDTLDQNSGVLWPDAAGTGGFDFLVKNQQHPEAWEGHISPDFAHLSGTIVWNNACRWTFEAVLDTDAFATVP